MEKKFLQIMYANIGEIQNKNILSLEKVSMKNEVLEFIQRRFKNDCNWLDGNCYYFAIILNNRFPDGKIVYDVINGHFVFEYKNELYDWKGIHNSDGILVDWESLEEYDYLFKKRVIRDCVL